MNNNSSIILLGVILLLSIIALVAPESMGMNIVFALSFIVAAVSILSFFYRLVVDFAAMKKFVIGAVALILVAVIFYASTEAKPTMGFVNDTVQEIADSGTTQLAGGILGVTGLLFAGAIIGLVVSEVKALIKR